MTLEEAMSMIVDLKAQLKTSSENYESLQLKNQELTQTLSERDENNPALRRISPIPRPRAVKTVCTIA